ncbi:sugar transferase [Allofustis seminis]|uniref:sugar transferase n=1 Tax=Allofustis seminis TaxID=166939 RepID=UPI00036C06C8|nr:sugar transferase [Allofustis seminis]
MLTSWNALPKAMQNDNVRPYYQALKKKRFALFIKRIGDILLSLLLLVLLSPLFLIISLMIKYDSKGPIFYRQTRITRDGKPFKIFKFRTMVTDADKKGSLVTTDHDTRITHVGHKIRDYRLDEIPQLLNILRGEMTFVGTRPEVPKYVDSYTDEMLATLLLPAGVTSIASIYYKDENKLIAQASDVDRVYIEDILPQKMKYNLHSLLDFGLMSDLRIMFLTIFHVVR